MAIAPVKNRHALEACRNHINDYSIWRTTFGESVPGKIDGTRYTWQFYLRRSLLDPKFQNNLSKVLEEALCPIFEQSPFQIGSCETAGVPLGMLIQTTMARCGHDVGHLIVRKSRKEYGLKNSIEGKSNGLPVLLVDDLAGSQQTLNIAKRELILSGIKVHPTYFALVDKSGRNGAGTHEDAYIGRGHLLTLFNLRDFDLSRDEYYHNSGGRFPPPFEQI